MTEEQRRRVIAKARSFQLALLDFKDALVDAASIESTPAGLSRLATVKALSDDIEGVIDGIVVDFGSESAY